MCGRVDEEHAKEHYVAGDAAGFGVVELNGRYVADEEAFDVEEAV